MELEKLFGRDNAAIVAQSHSTAVEWIGSVVREEGIDCQYSVVSCQINWVSHGELAATLIS